MVVIVTAAAAAVDIDDVRVARVSRDSRSRRLLFCDVSTPNNGSIPLSPRSRLFSTGVLMFNDDANAMGCNCQGYSIGRNIIKTKK